MKNTSFVYQVDKIDNNLYLIGEINMESINELHQHINKIERDNNITSLNFYITSDGGSVSEGLKLFDILQSSRLNITIYATGFVASAGTIPLFTRHKTVMYKNTMLVFHELRHWSDDSLSNVTARLNMAERLLDKIMTIYNSKTSEITKEWLIVDKYLDSEQALAMKIVDEVI